MIKENFYKISITILLVLNLLQLLGFLFAQKHQPEPINLKDRAAQILNLNKEQERQFLNLAEEHRDEIIKLHDKQAKLTSEYFTSLDSLLLQSISAIEVEKIKKTNKHFSNIQNILNRNQLPAFKQFKKEFLRHILREEPDKRLPKKPK